MGYQKILIHDLAEREARQLPAGADMLHVDANGKAAHCQGCFGCWLKTPGVCVLKDAFQYMGAALAQAEEITIISRSCYGGVGPAVKKVLDRSIAASSPFFTYRSGKIHHFLRYKRRPRAVVYLYGEMTDFEKQVADEVVKANAINMGWRDAALHFAPAAGQILEALS